MVDDMLIRQTLMHSIPKGPHNLANFPYSIHEVVYHVQDIFSRPLYQTLAVYVLRDLSKLLVSSKLRPVSLFRLLSTQSECSFFKNILQILHLLHLCLLYSQLLLKVTFRFSKISYVFYMLFIFASFFLIYTGILQILRNPRLDGWVQKLAIFAYFQYIEEGGWVRKSQKTYHTSCIGFQMAKKLPAPNLAFQAFWRFIETKNKKKKNNSRESFFRKSPFCTFS